MEVRRWLLMLGLLGALLGAGCEQSAPRIGVVPKGGESVFWQGVRAGAEAAGGESGGVIDWQSPPDESDIDAQISIVEGMVASGVDGIVLAPSHAVRLVAAVMKANQAGIPVVIFDSGINTRDHVSFVATNNYTAGVLAARKLGEILEGPASVALVKTAPGNAATTEREWGFEETLASEFPNLTIVAEEFCMADKARAAAVSEEMLSEHEGLGAIFASNEPGTLGTAEALKKLDMAGKVRFIGFDFAEPFREDLKNGVLDAAVVQDPFNIGFTAVTTIIAKLKGETPKSVIESPVQVLTATDLERPEIIELLDMGLN